MQYTLKQIHADLREIRTYYHSRDLFEKGKTVIFPKAVQDKVDRYKQIIGEAPAKLYAIYISLYVEGNTQQAFCLQMGYSIDYAADLNKELCLFLQRHLNKGGAKA